MQTVIEKAGVLVEAIPYIHDFRRKVFVIKYGGSILENDSIRKNVLEDIVFLSFVGIQVIIVHGGGPHISKRIKEMGGEPVFHDGIRVTDKMTLKVVQEELDVLNHKIVDQIKSLRGDVISLKGHQKIVIANKKPSSVDLGFVGTVTSINKEAVEKHLKEGRVAVISPMGVGHDGQLYNVNADEVAGSIARAFKAEKIVLLTDVPGVMKDSKDSESLISTLTVKKTEDLIKQGIIAGGMIPKVRSCTDVLDGGVKKAHIVDARQRHALLLEIFTDKGIGTQILAYE